MLLKRSNKIIKAPDSIMAFAQHGFIYDPKNETDSQIFGKCVFCGSTGKHKNTFYINKETKKWDCKSCGKTGGFQTFLEEIVSFSKSKLVRSDAMYLCDRRNLSLKTFRRWEVGFNPINDSYVIPIYNIEHDKLWNVYYWKDKVGMRGTATCQPALYGWHNFNKNGDVWLCEGEFDAMAMDEILYLCGKDNDVVCATTSAGTFKSEWVQLFNGRKVNIIYDNDDAGRGHINERGVPKGGMQLAKSMLLPVVAELNFIHWPESYKKGFDISDLYAKLEKKPKSTYNTLKQFLKCFPPSSKQDIENEEKVATSKIIKYEGEGIHHEQVYKEYKKYLLVKDTSVIDLIYGAFIANRLPEDPVWLFLVAPPGGSKSEFLMSIDDAPGIFSITGMTSKTLISGAVGPGGSDPSLIAMLNEKVLVIKDFTTILTQSSFDKDAIFGMLRDAYDGKIDWQFGSGLQRRYITHFGIIAGVTPAIELMMDNDAILGARFLHFNMPAYTDYDEQRAIIRCAISHTSKHNNMRDELKKIGKLVLSKNFDTLPNVQEDMLEKLISLTQWLALMRGQVNRQKYTDLVTHTPFSEVGTRPGKQLVKLAQGISMFRGEKEISEYTYNIIIKVARSSCPSRNNSILKFLSRSLEAKTVQEIGSAIRLPPQTVNIVLDNMIMFNILNRKKLDTSKSVYSVSAAMNRLIIESNVYKRSIKDV